MSGPPLLSSARVVFLRLADPISSSRLVGDIVAVLLGFCLFILEPSLWRLLLNLKSFHTAELIFISEDFVF